MRTKCLFLVICHIGKYYYKLWKPFQLWMANSRIYGRKRGGQPFWNYSKYYACFELCLLILNQYFFFSFEWARINKNKHLHFVLTIAFNNTKFQYIAILWALISILLIELLSVIYDIVFFFKYLFIFILGELAGVRMAIDRHSHSHSHSHSHATHLYCKMCLNWKFRNK